MVDGLITLYFDKESLDLLRRDHEYYNKDQAFSRTIKRIIVNHAETYKEESEKLKNKIESTIKDQSDALVLSDVELTNIAWKITKYIGENKSTKAISPNKKKSKKEKVNIRLNINSTEDSRIEMILDKRPLSAGESDYLASIINSYLQLKQTQREKVLYKDVVESIEYAIKNKRMIRFKSKKSKKIRTVLPVGIHISDEEIYNYCLYQEYNDEEQRYHGTSIHLFNITNVEVEADTGTIRPEIEVLFDRMIRNGVQFNIDEEDPLIKVKLTDEGVRQFNFRYIEQPDVLDSSDLEHNIYHFDCSTWHFFKYFAPFYKELTILEPEYIKDELVDKLTNTLKNYK